MVQERGWPGEFVSETAQRSLASLPLFAGLDAQELRSLEQHARWRHFKPGERILESGSDSRDVFFMLQGSASAVNYSFSGREVAFATFNAGEFFGELSALDAQPRSASVVATEECQLATLPGEVFLDLLRRRVEVTFKVFQHLAAMVRASTVRIMELSTLAAAARVYSELLRMSKPDAAVAGLWIVRPLPPLREIASHASTTRETVTRALSQLYPTGLMRRKGRNLFITDRARLEVLIQQLQMTGGQKT